MSGTELILTALATGATAGTAAGVTATTSAAITDAYAGLKALLARKLTASGRKNIPALIEDDRRNGSQEFRAQLAELLESADAAEDEELLTAAKSLLALAGADGPGGKFAGMDVRDNKGVQIGDNNTQDNKFLLGVHVHPPQPDSVIPRQLPAPTPYFVARDDEVTALTDLAHLAAAGRTVVVSALGGTAGIGKTALAVWWAHQVIDEFPDGQLYVNLRGFGPAEDVMDSTTAVRGFLDAFDIPPDRIPAGLDAQAALYRSLVAGKRILIVLDNARDAEQVRPLLPGARQCLVVVTSRNRLESLIAMEGARPVDLDLLSDDGARALLAARLGADRLAAEPDAVDDIIAYCARLPLALAIVAARAAIKPRFPLSAIAAQLRAAQDRIEALSSGDVATDMRAVFSWSYSILSPAAAGMFRLLGLHPGPDLSARAAAGLAGLAPARAQSLLTELERANLVKEPVPGRYAFHDLLRDYAGELAHSTDSEDHRRAAIRRLLDHYLHTGHAAARHMNPNKPSIDLPPPISGNAAHDLRTYQDAWVWLEAEHQEMVAMARLALEHGEYGYAWRLPWTLTTYFNRRGYLEEYATSQRIAMEASAFDGVVAGQAQSSRYLANALVLLGRPQEALQHYERAIELFGECGQPEGKAFALRGLAWAHQQLGRMEDAKEWAQRARALHHDIDNRAGEAQALSLLTFINVKLGDAAAAMTTGRRALELYQEIGDPDGGGMAYDMLGLALDASGRYREAVNSFHSAIAIYEELSDQVDAAKTYQRLGETYIKLGEVSAAADAWQRALTVYEQLKHPDAVEVRASLRSILSP